ncbi:Putative cyclase [Macrophomina phaseolina MS6]|uniref:Putative cyclase n=1 Tax=Macrophomina phaseolina (strain MS6) TaxID=1126212 RepID=K2QPG0_MACPH|nr:Putative cyclase [Macrophomina phaseolina MS6]
MSDQSALEIPFDQLPDPKRVWVGKPGSREEGLGKLLLLTPERVAHAAASEIKTGRRVTLGWDLNKLEFAAFNRQPCQLNIVPLLGGVAFDDIYTFNPQQSSQWDGLRHFSQPASEGSTERVFYGGTTKEEILDRKNDRIGMQHWARAGIAGRGVLIDYASWAERQGMKYTTFSQHEIKLADILEIAKESNITFQKGDILFVRIGMTKEWEHVMDESAKRAYAATSSPCHAGVEGTKDVLRWLWDTGFSAIAGDAISWEVYPPRPGGIMMHEFILAGWGVPIGEMFDLEELAAMCKELNRWTFFVSSVPLNMPGGVSSPPNAMAVF